VETLCFQRVVESVFSAGGTFVGIACDVVKEFPLGPFVVGPVRSATAGQAVDLRDAGKGVGVVRYLFEGLVSEAHKPGLEVEEAPERNTNPSRREGHPVNTAWMVIAEASRDVPSGLV
jgi:hypothetical protein